MAQSKKRATMRKSGLSVPLAALLSGVLTVAAAQVLARDSSIKQEPRADNPLWEIALGDLSETQARPLFSPSRRPPAPPILAAVAASPVKLAPPAKSGPDHPLLALLGTIVSDSVEIGIFTDEVSHDVIRVRAGETHDGWTLSSVSGRTAIFQKAGHPAATLALPVPSAEGSPESGGNSRIRFAPPVSNFIPVNKEGGSRRPPKEG